MIFYLIRTAFEIYFILLLVRILGSWIPSLAHSKFMRFVGFYTDPYLNVFRRIIPPIGGLDISPVLAFFVLRGVEQVLFMLLQKLFYL